MKYSELVKKLKKAGCTVYRQGANHTQWYSQITGKIFSVGRHKTEDVKAKTLKSIMQSAGLK